MENTKHQVTAQAIAEALGGRKSGNGYVALCPAHDDRNPSLSISEVEGRILLFCHAGCPFDQVKDKLVGMNLWHRPTTSRESKDYSFKLAGTFIYEIETGQIGLRVKRFESSSGRKKFSQEYFDGKEYRLGGEKNLNVPLAPYRFSEWKDSPETIYLVEGEKKVDFLKDMGFKATTSLGGSGNWNDRLSKYFHRKNIIILPDCDSPGKNYAEKIKNSLIPVCGSLKIIELPGLLEGEDVIDWVRNGGAKEELTKLANESTLIAKDGIRHDPDLFCMSDVKHELVNWIWHPYIPKGYVTFIEGDPGVGKSFITLALASEISKGKPLFGMSEGLQGKVLLFNAEDGLSDTLKSRLNDLGANQFQIHAYRFPPSLDTEGKIVFENALRAVRPKIVFLDPLSAFLGSDIDMYKPNHVRPFMKYLGERAHEFQCAIVIVRHLTKSGKDHAIYRGTGSIDFVGAARSALLVGCDPDDEKNCAMVHIKSNCGPKGVSIGYRLDNGLFQWTGESSLTQERILSSGSAELADPSALEEAKDFLLEELSLAAQKQKKITSNAKAIGISKRTLDRAKKGLGVISLKDGVDWLWRLPNQDCQGPYVEKLATLPPNGNLPPAKPCEEGLI